MAWFNKSLEDMKKAIEQENWKEVKKILQQHNRSLDRNAPEVEHDLSNIALRISKYGEDITQISHMLASKMKGSNTKNLMLIKVESAIENAHFFEKTIMHLIKERKFME
jgi:hypothetical protein